MKRTKNIVGIFLAICAGNLSYAASSMPQNASQPLSPTINDQESPEPPKPPDDTSLFGQGFNAASSLANAASWTGLINQPSALKAATTLPLAYALHKMGWYSPKSGENRTEKLVALSTLLLALGQNKMLPLIPQYLKSESGYIGGISPTSWAGQALGSLGIQGNSGALSLIGNMGLSLWKGSSGGSPGRLSQIAEHGTQYLAKALAMAAITGVVAFTIRKIAQLTNLDPNDEQLKNVLLGVATQADAIQAEIEKIKTILPQNFVQELEGKMMVHFITINNLADKKMIFDDQAKQLLEAQLIELRKELSIAVILARQKTLSVNSAQITTTPFQPTLGAPAVKQIAPPTTQHRSPGRTGRTKAWSTNTYRRTGRGVRTR